MIITKKFLSSWDDRVGEKQKESLWPLQDGTGLCSHEDNKNIVKLFREKINRAKAQLQLKLATVSKDNKYFYKCINNKIRTGENLQPLLEAEGNSD